MNVELADYLIGLRKYIAEDGKVLDQYLLTLNYPIDFRLTLVTPDDMDQNLMIKIWESSKKSFKMTLHHQDDNTQNGLLRVDYNSRHKNPETITHTVPPQFHPYAGIYLDDFAGHIHYVVDGYKPLVWAIPLEVDDFPVKALHQREDYVHTLAAFFQKINLKTKVTCSTQTTFL